MDYVVWCEMNYDDSGDGDDDPSLLATKETKQAHARRNDSIFPSRLIQSCFSCFAGL